MKTIPAFSVTVYIAGEVSTARQVTRRFCDIGLCVTLTPTTFIYTSGAEEGVAVGLVNYPRLPLTPEAIKKTAIKLARKLMTSMCQRSALVVTPAESIWLTKEKQ